MAKNTKRNKQNDATTTPATPATAQNTVDTAAPATVSSPVLEPVTANPVAQEKKVMFKLKSLSAVGDARYTVPGVARGQMVIGHQLLAEGAQFPAEIADLADLPLKTGAPATPRLTKEERAAKRAAMSPADKLAEQEARLAKQTENLAKRKAALEAAQASA